MGKTSDSSARGAPVKKNGTRTVRSRKINFSEVPEANQHQVVAAFLIGSALAASLLFSGFPGSSLNACDSDGSSSAMLPF